MGPYTPPSKNVRPPAPRPRQLAVLLPAPDGTYRLRYALAHIESGRLLWITC